MLCFLPTVAVRYCCAGTPVGLLLYGWAAHLHAYVAWVRTQFGQDHVSLHAMPCTVDRVHCALHWVTSDAQLHCRLRLHCSSRSNGCSTAQPKPTTICFEQYIKPWCAHIRPCISNALSAHRCRSDGAVTSTMHWWRHWMPGGGTSYCALCVASAGVTGAVLHQLFNVHPLACIHEVSTCLAVQDQPVASLCFAVCVHLLDELYALCAD